YHLWAGGWAAATIRIYDDGIQEAYWLGYEPQEFEIEPGSDMDVVVTLNAEGLIGGDYEADLHFFSNDPDDPDVAVNVLLHVTGIPVINVTWPEAYGYPDVVDFNRAYQDLFTGGPYRVAVAVINEGTEDLAVEDVVSDHDYFSAEPTEFVVAPGERQMVDIILNAQEDGVHEGTITFISNAENAGEYPIAVRGETSSPPVIVVEPQMIEDELANGQSREHIINVANEGEALLRWDTDIEIIREPGRDNPRGRGLREVALPEVMDWGVGVNLPNSADPIWTQEGAVVYKGEYPVGRAVGPRRDQPESQFLLIQQTNPWGFNLESIFSGFQGLNYRRIQTPDQLDNLDLNDYQCMWVGNYESDAWNNLYNQRLATIEDWVDRGNAYYMSTGTNNWGTAPVHPGRLTRVGQAYAMEGVTVVGQDENFLFDMMDWDEGQRMSGNWFTHSLYREGDLQNIENMDEYQVMIVAAGQVSGNAQQGMPAVVVYNYGSGWCVVSGTTDGFLHNNPNAYIWGQTGRAMLWYLDYLAHLRRWISWEPREGTVEPGSDMDVVVTLDAGDNEAGEYEADLHFLSNDPAHPDVVVNILLNIIGIPAVVTDPLAHPFEGAPEVIEFPSTYVLGSSEIGVTMNNAGTDVLVVEGIEVENGDDFGTDLEEGLEIEPRGRIRFNLIFHPSDVGDREGVVHIYTNAANVEDGHIWFSVAGRGITPPDIATEPEAGSTILVMARPDSDPVERTLRIENVADENGDVLNWAITTDEAEEGVLGAVVRFEDIGPIRDRRGGPDQAGYEWRDSDERDGPRFQWIDVPNLEGRQQLQAGDDVNVGPLNLGFEFPWYGQNYSQIRACSNGWITFSGSQSVAISLPNPPNPGDPNAIIAGHNYDLNPGAGGAWYFWTNQQDLAVVHWQAVPRFGNAAITTTFQIVLHGNGFAVIQYGPQQNVNQGEVMVGYEDHNGQLGAAIIPRGQGGTREGLAIGIGQRHHWGIPWLTVDPMEGSLGPGEDQDVSLVFDPSGLEEDREYRGILTITSNDPDEGEIVINVELRTGFPELRHFTDFVETDVNHSLLVTGVTFDREPVPTGWEVGVFTPGEVLAGAMVWIDDGEPHGFAAWGDDAQTEEVEGFRNNEVLTFRLWDDQADREWPARPTIAEGPSVWVANGFTVLSLAGFSMRELTVNFVSGWNMISINVVPEPQFWARNEGPDVVRMLRQLARDPNDLQNTHHVIIFKDERGRFYSPRFGFNNIPYWNLTEGYQVKVDEALSTTWDGAPIAADADVPISTGWNLIAYFPDYQLTCRAPEFRAISPIRDYVIIAKDARGNFAAPRLNFSNMPPWTQGQGYQIKVSQDVVLNYPAPAAQAASVGEEVSFHPHWAEPTITGVNMSVLVTRFEGLEVSDGDQVAAVNTSGQVVGTGFVQDGMAGLAVWGDDPSTDIVEGLREGEAFALKIWSAKADGEYDLKITALREGSGLVFEPDGFVALEGAAVVIPEEFFLSFNYPNPFNSLTRLEFGLPEEAEVVVKVYDLAGREVATLAQGKLQAGLHRVVWDARNASAGLYIVRMEAGSFRAVRKMMLVR
ncbi:MAG: FlgD immunoglobulin-like domain containing protein, partial [bacterium]